jgi:hypothetical protein
MDTDARLKLSTQNIDMTIQRELEHKLDVNLFNAGMKLKVGNNDFVHLERKLEDIRTMVENSFESTISGTRAEIKVDLC